MAKDNETFTGSKCDIPKVNLRDLTEICTTFRKDALMSFDGVPLKIDTSLEGNQYYIALSQDLYNLIEDERAKRG